MNSSRKTIEITVEVSNKPTKGVYKWLIISTIRISNFADRKKNYNYS